MAFRVLKAALGLCGGQIEPIARKDRHHLLQAWREIYAAPYFDQKGRWKLNEFEWHVFSLGYTRALNGDRAMAEYSSETAMSLIVCPENEGLPVSKILKGQLPDFHKLGVDVYVWPDDLSWTMAFTHEATSGLGPYFSRMEWAIACRTARRDRRRSGKRTRPGAGW